MNSSHIFSRLRPILTAPATWTTRHRNRTMNFTPNSYQRGSINAMAISLITAVVLLLGSIGFGAWAYNGRQNYKNNVDALVATAVTAAKQQQSTTDNAEFAQAEKRPLRDYNGPQAYGSLDVAFPRTWSSYVDDTGNGSSLVDGYFAPSTVPSINSQASIFALRVQVQQESYSQVVQQFNGLEQGGQLTAQAYSLPKVSKVVGVEVNGQLPGGHIGTMVALPLRSDTLEIWTQGTSFLSDFNTIILPNFSFSP